MEFCSDCGSVIQPTTNDDGQTVLDCSSCDYRAVQEETVSISEESDSQSSVEVVEEDGSDTKPIVDKECDECGNDQAKFWTVQTRAGDEPETRFYECTECGNKWREY